ncbi:MAG: hypothetical protein JKY48_02955 [Flavobacteriales bacterium]|nr:hypothetical protein [Flavobacteriales bacterium]
MKQIGVLFLLFTLLTLACKDDDTTLPEEFVGLQYLPLKVGQESIYKIDSIIYNEFTGGVDTIRLQLRELVYESILDAEQRKAFEIGIYQRANDTLEWRLIRVIRKTRTASKYELLDNNQRTVPLIFPVSMDKKWDVNSLNATAEVEYLYKSVNESLLLNGVNYDSTLSVIQLDEENLIERQFAEEKYALGFGLIYRRDLNIETDFDNNILSGYDATVELISFSN